MQICTRTQNVKCDLLFLQKLPKAPFRFVSTEMKSDNSGNVSGLQSAFNRTMTSHKCTSSPIHIKEESDVTKNVRCHKFTFSGKLNIFIKISSIKKIMVPNKSTFKKKIKSHISLQEDNYVT
jgi:cytoskeletal protein CcmA (bactofilin family)